MATTKRVGRGRGRGVLALTSYEPCPRPKIQQHQQSNADMKSQENVYSSHSSDIRKPVNVVKPLPTSDKQQDENSCENQDNLKSG